MKTLDQVRENIKYDIIVKYSKIIMDYIKYVDINGI